mmetsp:Transcript_45113/g.52175  ORF Transcript_45113/g.52175 Transcript_45113/m.52175 type:complete len:178 (-) Transcript_45113:92-625(-)
MSMLPNEDISTAPAVVVGANGEVPVDPTSVTIIAASTSECDEDSRTHGSSSTTASAAATSGGGAPEAALAAYFEQMRAYVASETEVQAEEWRFMDRCNGALRARYAKLRQQADVVVQAVSDSQSALARLPEFYGKIDELTRSLEALESIAAGLETYSLVLEDMYVSGGGGERDQPQP